MITTKILLVTNPAEDGDPATLYFDAWIREILDRARRSTDVIVHELRGSSVTRENFSEVIATEKPNFIILNGHGDYETIKGFGSAVLVHYRDNEASLRDAIVHSLACSAGKTLGPACIESGTVAYIGYQEKFRGAYLAGAKTPEERQRDSVAELILEPAFEVVSAIIEGNTVEKAYQRSRRKYAENLQFLLTTLNPNTEQIALRIRDNLKNQVCLGNGSAKWI